jgi:hypothetical protein
MEAALVGGLAALIGVPIVMAMLGRLYPVTGAADETRSLEELRREFLRWDLAARALLLLVAPATGYVWWRVFVNLGSAVERSYPEAAFTFPPTPIAWALPALFAGIVSSGPVITSSMKLILGERYPRFLSYQDSIYRMNTQAMNRPFYIGSVSMIAIGVFIIANWYTYVTDTHLVANPFFGFSEQSHRLSDLTQIRTAPTLIAPNGNRVQRREYVLKFADGGHWTTKWNPSESSADVIQALISHVSSKGGVPPTELEYLANDEF